MTEAHEKLLQTTRGRVILLIRSGLGTVNELAAALGVTDNGVRTHLASLQREGLVTQAGFQPAHRKPNQLYALTEAGEQLFPKPYDRVLAVLLDVLDEKLPSAARRRALREVGRRLALQHKPQVTGDSLRERLDQTVAVLNQMGGAAEIVRTGEKSVIRSRSCPLASVVRGHPAVCKAVQTMISELLGSSVCECCHKGERPRCEFEIRDEKGIRDKG